MNEARHDVDVVREMYRAFERADVGRSLELCAPEVTVHQSPAVPWGGDYTGRDGVVRFLTALGGALDSRPETERLFADGDGRVVQVGRTRGTVRRTGRRFDVAETHVWTVRDGLVVRFEAYIDVPAMLPALAPDDEHDRTSGVPAPVGASVPGVGAS